MIRFRLLHPALLLSAGSILSASLLILAPISNAVAAPLRIMPLGDSITEGHQSCSYRKPLVEGLLGCDFNMVGSQNGAVSVPGSVNCLSSNDYHQGIGGWTAADFLADNGEGKRWVEDYVSYYSPDLVLLHIGSNDMFQNQAVGSYNENTLSGSGTIGNIDRMIRTIYQFSPNATVLVANLIPWFDDSTVNHRIKQLRTSIEVLVSARKSAGDAIHLVDVAGGFSSGWLSDDKVHPNSHGENHLAGQFKDVMQSNGFCTNATGSIPDPAPDTPDQSLAVKIRWNKVVPVIEEN